MSTTFAQAVAEALRQRGIVVPPAPRVRVTVTLPSTHERLPALVIPQHEEDDADTELDLPDDAFTQLAALDADPSQGFEFQVRARSFKARPYQAEGIEFLRRTKRAVLGDAPGLGKTFQATEAAELPCVISAPSSLVQQWADFIQDQYPNDRVLVASKGSMLERAKLVMTPQSEWDWMLVNHDMFRQYPMPTTAKTFIADELHHFKNSDSERSKGAFAYSQLVPRFYGLTATLVHKDVADLWHPLHMIDKATFSSYWSFINRYAVTVDYGFGRKVLRRANVEELDRRLETYLLQRTYKQVGMFLPKQINKNIVLTMDDALKAVYRKLATQYILELEDGEKRRFFNAGAALHALRRLTIDDNKIEAVKDIIDDTDGDDPILVFVWYKDTADLVASAVDGAVITGDIKPDDRRLLARNSSKRVRVCTMSSMSEGVDLSAAHTVIFVEETYVPGQKFQALSRAVRARNSDDQSPVILYWVRYKDTVDEVVHNTANRRTAGNALSVLREALGVE